MVCFTCGGNTVVTNSRAQKRSNGVWRRRRCILCDTVFTSIEAIDYSKNVHVVSAPAARGNAKTGAGKSKTAALKKTGSQPAAAEPFSRDRLFMSLYKSLQHRPAALADASILTDSLLPDVMARAENFCVTRTDIVRVVVPVLTRFDKLAGQHYAAMHTF